MPSIRWFAPCLHGAGTVVVGGPAFEGEAFQPPDVDPFDVHRVPDRLEDPVEEPQGDDPADELAGQEMVDPEDHRLGQLDAQDLVEVLRGGQVGAEGFFDRRPRLRRAARLPPRRAGPTRSRPGQREVDRRIRTILADHPADVLRPGDVCGLVAEHPRHGVACGRGHAGRHVCQLTADVLAEVLADQSVLAEPTMVSRGGRSPASASCASAGISRRLVRSPEAPKTTIRSITGCRLSLVVAGRGRVRQGRWRGRDSRVPR